MTEHRKRTDTFAREADHAPVTGCEMTPEQPRRQSRRRFLLGAGATVALLAGCVGDDADDEADDDSPAATDDGDDDPGDDGPGDDGDADPGDDSDDSADADGQEFVDTFRWTDEYRAVIVDAERNIESEMRFHGENSYHRSTIQGMETEIYLIGDETYTVTDGQCLLVEEPPDEADQGEPDGEEIQEDNLAALSRVGTDTIDGDSVTVYELRAEDSVFMEEDTTYYVLDSGYLRRIEVGEMTVDYFDWGDTDPVEPPDMDCSDFGDFPGDFGDFPDDFPDDLPDDFPDDYP